MAMIKIHNDIYDIIKTEPTKRGIRGATQRINQILSEHCSKQAGVVPPTYPDGSRTTPVEHVSPNKNQAVWFDEDNT
jgi:hypothetical protein